MTSEEILHRRSRPSRDSAMAEFETRRLPATRDVVAPDGSDVRVLLGLGGGGMAHFELAPGLTSCAMAHRTVEEIWFFVGGHGEMWRKSDTREEVVSVEANVWITIHLWTRFQFRSWRPDALAAVEVTYPPWPGES